LGQAISLGNRVADGVRNQGFEGKLTKATKRLPKNFVSFVVFGLETNAPKISTPRLVGYSWNAGLKTT
jgi:hypothetical protein